MNLPLRSWKATSINSELIQFRSATLDDVGELRCLIEASARGLNGGDYSAAQIEAALLGTYGVDTQLIQDGTYWVAQHRETLVAAGGWSFRAALCGGDALPGKASASLDPSVDAARIRAFFVLPSFARQGLARQLLSRCETAAAQRGFRRLTLLATLPGVRLYAACGYRADAPIEQQVENIKMLFVPMHISLSAAANA